MPTEDEKHEAFATALLALAIRPEQTTNIGYAYVRNARKGFYASGRVRPAFLGSYFRMTEQDWDALWALIYG